MLRCTSCNKTLAHQGAVTGHLRSKEHRANGGDPNGTDITMHVPEDVTTVPDTNPEFEALVAEVERLVAENTRLAARADALDPYVSWPIFNTAKDVIDYFGPAGMRTLAAAALARDNRRATRQGNPPLFSTMESAAYEALIADKISELAEKRVRMRTRWVPDDSNNRVKMRTVKLVKPKKKDDGTLSYELREGAELVQLPLEGQVNNGAGSIADPVLRYTNRGAKLPRPPFCHLYDCYEPAAVMNGRPVFQGYCSEDHRQTIEGVSATGRVSGSAGERVPVLMAGYSGS
jgi:hypothetical protein